MWAALLAAAANPEVDAAVVSAITGIIKFVESLPEKDAEKVKAWLDGQAAQAHAASDAADADNDATKDYLDQLAAHEDDKVKAIGEALKSQLLARFSQPMPAPTVVKEGA